MVSNFACSFSAWLANSFVLASWRSRWAPSRRVAASHFWRKLNGSTETGWSFSSSIAVASLPIARTERVSDLPTSLAPSSAAPPTRVSLSSLPIAPPNLAPIPPPTSPPRPAKSAFHSISSTILRFLASLSRTLFCLSKAAL